MLAHPGLFICHFIVDRYPWLLAHSKSEQRCLLRSEILVKCFHGMPVLAATAVRQSYERLWQVMELPKKICATGSRRQRVIAFNLFSEAAQLEFAQFHT